MWAWSSKGRVHPEWKKSYYWTEFFIEHCQSSDQQPCKFTGERAHKERVQLPQGWFGTPTWPSFYCFGSHQNGCCGIMWTHFIEPTKICFFPKDGIWPPPQGMQYENSKIKETYLLSRLFCSASARSIDLTIFVVPIKLSKYFYKIWKNSVLHLLGSPNKIILHVLVPHVHTQTNFPHLPPCTSSGFFFFHACIYFLLSYQRVLYQNRKLLSTLTLEFCLQFSTRCL